MTGKMYRYVPGFQHNTLKLLSNPGRRSLLSTVQWTIPECAQATQPMSCRVVRGSTAVADRSPVSTLCGRSFEERGRVLFSSRCAVVPLSFSSLPGLSCVPSGEFVTQNRQSYVIPTRAYKRAANTAVLVPQSTPIAFCPRPFAAAQPSEEMGKFLLASSSCASMSPVFPSLHPTFFLPTHAPPPPRCRFQTN